MDADFFSSTLAASSADFGISGIPLFDGEDSLRTAWKDVNGRVEDFERLTEPMKRVVRTLLQEREDIRSQLDRSIADSTRYYQEINNLNADKDARDAVIDGLKSEIKGYKNKISVMLAEQREFKQKWLSDKADLNLRISQTNALHHQAMGQLTKKERDYETLQKQVTKMVRDSARGLKSTIFVSSLATKTPGLELDNKPAATLLRETEIISLKNVITKYERDNESLREAMKVLRSKEDSSNDGLHHAMEALKEAHQAEIRSMEDRYRRLMRRNSIAEESESLKRRRESMNAAPSTPSKEENVAPKMMECTPGARSISWVPGQVNEEVQELRNRAEEVASGSSHPHNSNLIPVEALPKVLALKSRLTEAIAVIEEQDRLIHKMLMSKEAASSDMSLFMMEEEVQETVKSLPKSTAKKSRSVIEEEDDSVSRLVTPAEDEPPQKKRNVEKMYGGLKSPAVRIPVASSTTETPIVLSISSSKSVEELLEAPSVARNTATVDLSTARPESVDWAMSSNVELTDLLLGEDSLMEDETDMLLESLMFTTTRRRSMSRNSELPPIPPPEKL